MVDERADLGFLTGGGEIADKVAAADWADTQLGPIGTWPQSLRTTVSLVLNSSFPMYLAWGPDLISFYNAAYEPFLAGRPEAMGRPFPEVWAETWSIFGPITAAAMRGEPSFYRDMRVMLQRGGRLEETWWTFSYSPVRNESGEVGGVLCVVQETTGEVQSRRQLAADRNHLAELLRQAPSMVAVLQGANHVFEIANEAYRELMGPRELIGKPAAEALPEVAAQGFIEMLDQVYRTGEAYIGHNVPFERPASPGRPSERRYLDFVYQPIVDSEGRVAGVFADGVDVTERKRAEDQQKLLLDELNHRVKNTLATVQSIAAQTVRGSRDLDAFGESFEARLLALARAHDLLTRETWKGADIVEIVRRAIEPFVAGGAHRFESGGPFQRLTPSQSLALSLALHELATNAVKYGSLSWPAGAVSIRWRVDTGSLNRELIVDWRERDGPEVAAPTTSGFGMRLLQKGLRRELGAEVRVHFRPGGLECDIAIPLHAAGQD